MWQKKEMFSSAIFKLLHIAQASEIGLNLQHRHTGRTVAGNVNVHTVRPLYSKCKYRLSLLFQEILSLIYIYIYPILARLRQYSD